MIYIGSDHRGVDLKNKISSHLFSLQLKVDLVGSIDNSRPSDYPDVAHELIGRMEEGDVGILICHTANGMSMTANKYSNIRAAICWGPEIAVLARQHNDANILCIPAGYIENDMKVYEMVDNFLHTEFEGGRHLTRVNKMNLN